MASDQQIGLTASAPIGSLQREWRRCGKATCRCTNGMLHGPYWYLRWRDRGRQRRRYVPRERVDDMLAAIEERRGPHGPYDRHLLSSAK
jgi:hypothetical protein